MMELGVTLLVIRRPVEAAEVVFEDFAHVVSGEGFDYGEVGGGFVAG